MNFACLVWGLQAARFLAGKFDPDFCAVILHLNRKA